MTYLDLSWLIQGWKRVYIWFTHVYIWKSNEHPWNSTYSPIRIHENPMIIQWSSIDSPWKPMLIQWYCHEPTLNLLRPAARHRGRPGRGAKPSLWLGCAAELHGLFLQQVGWTWIFGGWKYGKNMGLYYIWYCMILYDTILYYMILYANNCIYSIFLLY